MLFCHSMKLNGGNTQKWWEHSNPTSCKQIYLDFLLSQVGGGVLKHQQAPWALIDTSKVVKQHKSVLNECW